MKSTIKIMLLGIAFILFGIYLRCLFIEHLYSFFIELIWTVLPIIGLLIAICGFIIEEHKKDLTEETYNMILQQKIKDEKELTCEKCGEKYKESYTSCPWCGHKDNQCQN